jgi:hypothetical protein|eukprot:COSAG01_NODE_5388_length_4291_cov_5.223760_3_plen_181_part_00
MSTVQHSASLLWPAEATLEWASCWIDQAGSKSEWGRAGFGRPGQKARILTMPPRGFRGVHLHVGECLGSLGESPTRPVTGCSPRTSSHAATPPGRVAGSPSALSPAPKRLARPPQAAVTPCAPSSPRKRSSLAGVSSITAYSDQQAGSAQYSEWGGSVIILKFCCSSRSRPRSRLFGHVC